MGECCVGKAEEGRKAPEGRKEGENPSEAFPSAMAMLDSEFWASVREEGLLVAALLASGNCFQGLCAVTSRPSATALPSLCCSLSSLCPSLELREALMEGAAANRDNAGTAAAAASLVPSWAEIAKGPTVRASVFANFNCSTTSCTEGRRPSRPHHRYSTSGRESGMGMAGNAAEVGDAATGEDCTAS